MKESNSKPLTFSLLALAALSLLITTPVRQKSLISGQSRTTSSTSDQIKLVVTVTDQYGRYVSALNKNAFTVLDDKTPQPITFFNDKDVPITVGILIDKYGSMSDPRIGQKDLINLVTEGLSRFIRLSNKNNEYFVMLLKGPQMLLTRTRDSNVVLATLDNLGSQNPKGSTVVYDGCYLGIEEVMKGAYDKGVILLITDGVDNNSTYRFRDLHRLQRESDVMIYSIYTGSARSYIAIEARDRLDTLSNDSGAIRFAPQNKESLVAVFDRIALELRHQYTIGIKPKGSTSDGKWHPIKVQVSLPPTSGGQAPHLIVRTREGYYAN